MTARDPLPAIVELQTCGTCGHSSKAKSGFIRCAEGKAYEMISPRLICQFVPPKWIPMTEHAAAKRDAQAGIDQAVDAADRAAEGWSELAFRFVKSYAASMQGKQYIGHDIVRASEVIGVAQPPNPKAWGGPIQRAAREGLIKRVGFAPDPNRHTNPVPLWETA